MKIKSINKDIIVAHRTIHIPTDTYTMLQKYASEMTKLHGFKISLPKAVTILLYRHFTPDNHYGNPTTANKAQEEVNKED